MRHRRLVSVLLAVGGAILATHPAFAQLDPLLFLKRVPPNVIIVVDTSRRMLEDASGGFRDPRTYIVSEQSDVATALGVNTLIATQYRRIYDNLTLTTNSPTQDEKFRADNIRGIGNDQATFSTFYDSTRIEIAKQGIAAAVGANPSGRWGLIRLRHDNPKWREAADCDKPVKPGNPALEPFGDSFPCNTQGPNKYGVYPARVDSPNFSLESGGGAVLVPPAADTAGTVLTIVNRKVETNDPADVLIPAGRGTKEIIDRPITHALEDARAQVVAAMDADTLRDCRNTVVVLVAGGQDEGDAAYETTHNPVTTAGTFVNVTAGGVTRRVPIFVAAIAPPAAEESQLQQIASASGGKYFNVATVNDVGRVINLAVQAGYGRAAELDTTAASEYLPVSPVVGTVNLKGANAADGSPLPNTDIATDPPESLPIPQRSNVLLTGGFALNAAPAGSTSPGFEGRLRAFRVFKPEPDATQPSGFKFVKDGTPLWPADTGRPETAGLARTPANPNDRNIFTYIPGLGILAFTATNAALLGGHLGGADPATLIPFVRAQPIGAIVGSTPAVMDPPSLDPPPDEAYGRPDAPGTYAGDHKDRRSIIWFGANDGMIHAVDARTGYEVWAFIPFNLLPKLRTLLDGQAVDKFDYFVDSSPKIAEVKFNGTTWKTLLLIGQAMGGTFYQAFDVTEAGMGGPPPDSDDSAGVLATFASPSRVPFLWSFPRYSEFDTAITAVIPVSDGTAGGEVRMYGDLKVSATPAEKGVGFAWSDPAVGPLNQDRTLNALIVGSGYFPPIEDNPALTGRGPSSPRAGRYLYLLKAEGGGAVGVPELLGGVTGCGGSGSIGCVDVGDSTANGRKNALQADPTAAGAYLGSPVVTKAYMGDVDGRYWRFDFTETGAISFSQMISTGQPIYASSALLFVGSSDQYMFFATGSDLLPAATDGGTGAFKLFGLKDNFPAAGASTSFSRNLATVSVSNGVTSGERPSTSPSVAGDIAFFTTTTESSSACTAASGRLYALTFLGGAAYDTDASGSVTKNESPVVRTVAGRATAPFIVDQHLYFASTGGEGGANVEIFGDPEDFNNGVGQVGVRLLSWRELR